MGELFRKNAEGHFEPTTKNDLQLRYDALPWLPNGFKEYIPYAEKDENNHMIEHHYMCETPESPDGCTYCAVGFSRCLVCEANDYSKEGEAVLRIPCTGVKVNAK